MNKGLCRNPGSLWLNPCFYFVGLGILVATISGFFSLNVADAVQIDRVVAVVGQDVITQSELERHQTPEEQKNGSSSSPLNPHLLRRLLERRALFQAAERRGMQVTHEELERALADIEQRNAFPNRETFREAVMASSPSWEQYLDELKTEITVANLLRREIDASLFVTDQEAQEYYERYPERFNQADQITLESIVFPASDSDRDAVRQTAEGVRIEMARGISFDQIIERYKDKAMPLGVFKRGELLPEVEQVVFDMEIGEVSSVIQTSAGFHLFRVKEKIKGGSFKASRQAIVSLLLNEKQNRLTREWFSQLREQTFIEIK